MRTQTEKAMRKRGSIGIVYSSTEHKLLILTSIHDVYNIYDIIYRSDIASVCK